MASDSPGVDAYLYRLNEMTQGDLAAQVSMYDVGDALGVDRDDAAQMAETLFMDGRAEFKTLAGGIGITAKGMEALGISPEPDSEAQTLGRGRLLSDPDRNTVNTLLDEIRSVLGAGTPDYPVLEGVIMDIKTLEVQMLAPEPKTAVAREVLRSIAHTLGEKDFPDMVRRLNTMVGDG